MSSVAGKLAPPFLAPYVASKHALEGLSQSLRRELLGYGIDVILIGPGAVATPIWDKTQEFDVDRFANSEYATPLQKFMQTFVESGRKGLPPEDIGALVYHALTSAKPRTRYTILRNSLMRWLVPRLLPDRTLDRLLGKQLGLIRSGTNASVLPDRAAAPPGRDRNQPAMAPVLGDLEPVEVHHLGPGGDEVLDELLLSVGAAVDLGERAKLGVRTEDQIDARAGPLDCARLAIAPFEHVLRVRDGFHVVPMSSRFTKKSLVSAPGPW